MSGILKVLLVIFTIIAILIFGAKYFGEPSWGGFAFYLIFFFGFLDVALSQCTDVQQV